MWSECNESSIDRSFSLTAWIAAIVSAGAVFLPMGSSIIHSGN